MRLTQTKKTKHTEQRRQYNVYKKVQKKKTKVQKKKTNTRSNSKSETPSSRTKTPSVGKSDVLKINLSSKTTTPGNHKSRTNRTSINSNKSKNVTSKKLTKIMTPHNEIVELPITYPGDSWVHQYLVEENHLSLDYYQKYKDSYLKEVYMKYWNLSYKNTNKNTKQDLPK